MLSQKGLSETNPLAYYIYLSITTIKSFYNNETRRFFDLKLHSDSDRLESSKGLMKSRNDEAENRTTKIPCFKHLLAVKNRTGVNVIKLFLPLSKMLQLSKLECSKQAWFDAQ